MSDPMSDGAFEVDGANGDAGQAGHSGLLAVEDIRHALSEAFRDTEGPFLSLGEDLEHAIGGFGDMAVRFEKLPEEITDNGRLTDSFERIRYSAGNIASLHDRSKQEAGALANLQHLNDAVGLCIERLTKTIEVIAVLATNAKIVTAQIRSETIEVANFASAIDALALAAVKTVHDYALEHEELTRILAKTASLRTLFIRDQSGRLGRVVTDVDKAMMLCRATQDGIATQLLDVARSTQRIGQEIAGLVMGLQIGDITRQRAEHVIEALHSLTEESAVSSLAAVQAAQLTHASEEFDLAIAQAKAKLSNLSAEAKMLVAVGEVIRTGLEGPGSTRHRVQENLSESATIVEAYRVNRDNVRSNIATTGSTLGKLIDQMKAVRWIESEVRLVALNATLKCQRLGQEGRALSVIAQELRGYANETVEHMAGLESCLQALGEASATFLESASSEDTSGIDQLQQLTDDALALIDDSNRQLSDELTRLCGDGTAVASRLNAALQVFPTLGQMSAGMKEAARSLTELAAVSFQPGSNGSHDFLRDRYTMASERIIYDRVLGASNGDTAVPLSPNAASKISDDALLDDILF